MAKLRVYCTLYSGSISVQNPGNATYQLIPGGSYYANFSINHSGSSTYKYYNFDCSELPSNANVSWVQLNYTVYGNGRVEARNIIFSCYINNTQKASGTAWFDNYNKSNESLYLSSTTASQLRANAANNYFLITEPGLEWTGFPLYLYAIELEITYTIPTFTITASADSGGSISPSGNVSVSSGGSQTFTIAPNAGYEIDTLKVNGSNVTKTTSYTFTNVTSNQSIAVTFKQSFNPAFAGAAMRQWHFGGR